MKKGIKSFRTRLISKSLGAVCIRRNKASQKQKSPESRTTAYIIHKTRISMGSHEINFERTENNVHADYV